MRNSFKFFHATVGLSLALLASGCGYNSLQGQDENVKAAWSEVENQYQRRSDLVPNLVEVVKGLFKCFSPACWAFDGGDFKKFYEKRTGKLYADTLVVPWDEVIKYIYNNRNYSLKRQTSLAIDLHKS